MIKLEESEKLVLEGRKHWFVAFTHIFGFSFRRLFPRSLFLWPENGIFTLEIINAGGVELAYLAYFSVLSGRCLCGCFFL